MPSHNTAAVVVIVVVDVIIIYYLLSQNISLHVKKSYSLKFVCIAT